MIVHESKGWVEFYVARTCVPGVAGRHVQRRTLLPRRRIALLSRKIAILTISGQGNFFSFRSGKMLPRVCIFSFRSGKIFAVVT